MPARTTCPDCGARLPPGAPHGLCPRCLLLGPTGVPAPRDDFEAKSSASSIPPFLVSLENTGDRLGRYKLVQKIGEGGCGVVYMAEQQEPIKRKVALKVIKLGMDTRQVIARFEAERQSLALMDHPNIAKVLDAGATDTGRPFFVMELVHGIRITDYCNDHHLCTRERLELFIQICQAIQHAHQKGIIHRDIKPSNILVTLRDGVPVPKVIDFGIAKATTDQVLTDKTLFTQFSMFVGTPAYMSPEQAEMSELGIDTRSDIYSLGILLYELLTGRTPFESPDLMQAGLDEVRRIIREEELPRPSTRLKTMAAADLTEVASQRHAEPARLCHLVRGDLDWIVMKALEKDRARRYETANGLAIDIQRHLAAEPVLARPPSRIYEFERTIQRHKVGFAATAMVLIALALGTLASTLEALRARRAEQGEGRSQQKAELEAKNARSAEANAKEKLRGSYLAQAQAGRWSHRAGRRFDGLELLHKAAAISPGMDLRNEAIACMALTDLHMIKKWVSHPKDGYFCNFDFKYERYAFAEANCTVHVRRVADDFDLIQLPGYGPKVQAIQFSPDGQFLLVGWGDHYENLEVVNLASKETVIRIFEPYCRTAEFNSESRLLAVTYDQRNHGFPVRIFDLLLKKQIASFSHNTLVNQLRFQPGPPERLLTSDESPVVRIWDWQKGEIVQRLNHPDWVTGIDWHPGGTIIATGCADLSVRLWEAGTGAELVKLEGHEGVPVQVSFNSTGDFLFSRGWEGVVRVWQPLGRHSSISHLISGYCYPFSRAEDQFGTALALGKVGILKVMGGYGFRVLQTSFPSNELAFSCEFSSGGKHLISTDRFGMRLWDLAGLNQLARVTEEQVWEHMVAIDLHGTNIFLANAEGIEKWSMVENPAEGRAELFRTGSFKLAGQRGPLLLSADGSTIGALTKDILHIFDVATGEEERQLRGGYQEIFGALSPRAKFAATWDRSSTNVQIWDIAKSNMFLTLPAHYSICCAFSPDGALFVVGDGVEFRAWDTDTWKSRYALPRDT